ncbi:MAG: glycosyltransferase family 4 protein [Candidatus Omnitrophica bacterium]|nr:glycosyltransferase family 4 protein [Candidatus Omnitrophota bacterium]
MRTLLLTYDFPPIVSGIGTVFYRIWKLLPAQDSFILAVTDQGDKAVDAASGLQVHRYPNISCRVTRIFLLMASAFRIIRKERIKVVICGVPLSIGVVGLLSKKLLRIPYCVFYYGGEAAKYKKKMFLFGVLRAVLENADAIIANSDFTKEEIIREFSIFSKKVTKITPATDSEIFSPGLDTTVLKRRLGIQHEKVILTVARLVRRKGIDAVLAALPLVKKEFQAIRYLVVGEGEDEGYLKRLVREHGLEQEVRFVGKVSDAELAWYYNLCDIYVMPNRATEGEEIVEGFGISFIEASSCAKAVIAGISGGVRDAVLDGRTGLLIDPNDIPGLAEGICRLLRDQDYRIQLGAHGRKMVQENFKWEQRAEILQELFQRLGNTNV